MSDTTGEYVIEGVDATEYPSAGSFKAAVYDAMDGVPGWLGDVKMQIIWHWANDQDMPDYLADLADELEHPEVEA